ncbi:hypothetical protein XELAEV_18016195mg [Xenopus laevis]|uniref:Uncharacterized protein n=1 Tax=Xenopus laevis TaxID=8355 RepID=A0A974DJE8_XENLA|nr:hypothetical protein XELAEV_18016195mg [Xenopus laevis]
MHTCYLDEPGGGGCQTAAEKMQRRSEDEEGESHTMWDVSHHRRGREGDRGWSVRGRSSWAEVEESLSGGGSHRGGEERSGSGRTRSSPSSRHVSPQTLETCGSSRTPARGSRDSPRARQLLDIMGREVCEGLEGQFQDTDWRTPPRTAPQSTDSDQDQNLDPQQPQEEGEVSDSPRAPQAQEHRAPRRAQSPAVIPVVPPRRKSPSFICLCVCPKHAKHIY